MDKSIQPKYFLYRPHWFGAFKSYNFQNTSDMYQIQIDKENEHFLFIIWIDLYGLFMEAFTYMKKFIFKCLLYYFLNSTNIFNIYVVK